MSLPVEFDRIARHFRPLAGPGSLDLTDDAAVLLPPQGRELVVTADAMVEGVHWLAGDAPDLVARKLLRVNLSDLAAMGAAPLGYLLTLSVPRSAGEDWFAGFAAGLAADQAAFGIALLGGDSTQTPGPISLTITALGHVAPGCAILRRGARPGDALWVTGTIGDGLLGLEALRGRLADPTGHLAGRYRLPTPRLGLPLAGLAHAAADVSDGLLQDAGHIARASGCRVVVEAPLIPLSPAARAAGPDWWETAITGGDDYELLLALPDGATPPFPATRIGWFEAGEGAALLGTDGREMQPRPGWSHWTET